MEISNYPDKEYKEVVIRMLTKLETGIGDLREKISMELESLIQNQAELKNTINKMKNKLEWPLPVWLTSLVHCPVTERLLVQFPVRVHT